MVFVRFLHKNDLIYSASLGVEVSPQKSKHPNARYPQSNGTPAAVSVVFHRSIHPTIPQFCPLPARPFIPSLLRRCQMAHPSTSHLSLRNLSLSPAQNRNLHPQRRTLRQPPPVRRHSSDGVSERHLQYPRRDLAHGDLPSSSAFRLREPHA